MSAALLAAVPFTYKTNETTPNQHEEIEVFKLSISILGFNLTLAMGFETDTEVISNLISYCLKTEKNNLEAFRKALKRLKGSFGIAVLFANDNEHIYCAKMSSPLLLGIGKNENYISSGLSAFSGLTNKVISFEDGEYAVVSKDTYEIFNKEDKKINKEVETINIDNINVDKGNFDHFMLKEIFEAPKVLKQTISEYIDIKNKKILFPHFDFNLKDVKEINIISCGTSYYASFIAKYFIEDIAKIKVNIDIASEFRYRDPLIDNKTLAIFISQSGETADTLAALRLAKLNNVKTLAVVNVTGSSISREADYVIHTYAGPEISVAATKSYITQLGIMYLIAFKTALANKKIQESEGRMLTSELEEAVEKVGKVLNLSEELRVCAERYKDTKSLFFIGRGLDYYHAMEGALKMKEISYIHCESYAGGELKHGTISLITPNTGVIAIATQKKLIDKMSSNIKEVCSRGANVLLFAPAGEKIDPEIYSTRIDLPSMDDVFMPLVSIVPLQLLAYYTAVARGCDVDKPRNLAKSVTVE